MKTINAYILNFFFSFRYIRNIYSITHGKRKFFEQEKKELADLGFFEDLNFLIDTLKVKNKKDPLTTNLWQINDGDNSRLTSSKIYDYQINFGLFSNSDNATTWPRGRFAIKVDLSDRIKPNTLSFNLYFLKDRKKFILHKRNNVLQFNIKVKDKDNWNFNSSMVEIIHLDNADLIWCEEIIKLASEERRYQKRKNNYSENEFKPENFLSIDNTNDRDRLDFIAGILKDNNFLGAFYFFYRDPVGTSLNSRKLFRDFYHQFDNDEFKFHSYFKNAAKYYFHQDELKFRFKEDFYKIYYNNHIYGKKEGYDPQFIKTNATRYIVERNGHLLFSFLSESDFEKIYPDITEYERFIISDKPKEAFPSFSSDRMSIGVLEKFYQHPNIPLEYELLDIKDRLCEIAEEKGIDTQELVMFSAHENEMYEQALETLSSLATYFGSGGSSRTLFNIMKSIDKDDN